MRLTTQPPARRRPTIQPSLPLPKAQTKSIVPGWIWFVFVCSFVFFLGTFYITSWTSTGPTFLPVEQSLPASSLDALTTYIASPLKPGMRNVPEALQVPLNDWAKFQPLMMVGVLCLGIRFIPSNNWTRLLIKTTIIILGTRYMVWRTWGDTLNFTNALTALLSLWVYAAEVYGFVMLVLTHFQYIWSTEDRRKAQADRYEQQIRAGEYLPSVDVYIPTYNEAEFIVRRTVLGCQALDYPNKKVYILDDSGRPHIQALAKELGCGYITQPEGFVNKHAKAGNLNNAWPQTDGELIVIFDADFVPFKHFLMRTVGFFQDPKVAVLQTPQDFYNPDHQARNLGLSHALPNDVQYFFQHFLSMADTANAVICCGTSFVMRRSALEEVGGFYTRTIGEDSATSMRMQTRGYRVICLNETLSMGEAPRNYKDFINQRMRWLQSNMQIFLSYKDIPVFQKLNWMQRSFYFVMACGPINPFIKATYLISPLLCLYLGTCNYLATTSEFFYFGAPYLLLLAGTFSWACHYNVSVFYSELYDLMVCFPFIGRVISTLRSPFGRGFKVTAKGVTAGAKNYNFKFTWPLLTIATLSLVMIVLQLIGRRVGIWEALNSEQFGLMFFWLIYNVIWLIIAVLAAIDQPELRKCDRFPLRTFCKLSDDAQTSAWGYTNNASDSGVQITLLTNHHLQPGELIEIEFLEHKFSIKAEVVRFHSTGQHAEVALKYVDVTTDQYRHLTEILYCNWTWWKRSKRLGGLDTIVMMLGSLLSLKPILSTYNRTSANH